MCRVVRLLSCVAGMSILSVVLASAASAHVSVGPLPQADSMTFKVIQSYSDGSQVAWIEVPAPGSSAEPEHPAPVLKLSPALSGSQSSAGGPVVTAEPKKQSQTVPVVLGVVALVVAVAAAVAAGLALIRSRRQTGERG